MSGMSAEQIILESGKSPELVAAFQLVAEAECMGEPRYPPQACRELARIVACRNYASVMLEVCHLVRVGALIGGGGGWEAFFWSDGLARGRLFQARVLQAARRRPALAAAVRPVAAGVEIAYPDGAFSISYGRMPFLAAVLEFLITTVGYPRLSALFRDAGGAAATRKALSLAANELSRQLYDYLKDHLPTAQAHRKFRRLIAFLEARRGASFDLSAIDDATILEFWLTESMTIDTDGVDFKTFVSAYRAFVRLRQTLEHAADKMAIDTARPIGPDREAGEVDPEAISEALTVIEEDRGPLAALDEEPAVAIKFLTKREKADLELLMDSGTAALALPLSLLRAEVFGAVQAQITQALRRRAADGELAAMIRADAAESYLERRAILDGLAAQVEKVLLASLHALARRRGRAAIPLLIALRPRLDLAPLAAILGLDERYSDNVVMLRADSVSDRFLSLLEDAGRVGPELSALMADARQAFRGVSRQGFADADLERPGAEDGHGAGATALVEIRQRIAAFLERLDTLAPPASDWQRQFETDRAVFARQFETLYGATR